MNMKQGVTRRTNPLMLVPTKERKALLANERKRRRTGEWGQWERIENPHWGRDGWLGEVQYVKKNRVFSVLVRDAGSAIHLAVSSLSGERPTWWEMQRIKNEVAGEEVTAVEVYPPQAETVDGAEMFHIWIVGKLPFGLTRA